MPGKTPSGSWSPTPIRSTMSWHSWGCARPRKTTTGNTVWIRRVTRLCCPPVDLDLDLVDGGVHHVSPHWLQRCISCFSSPDRRPRFAGPLSCVPFAPKECLDNPDPELLPVLRIRTPYAE